ncbi:MAG TPA: hypothetical protein VFW16_16175 [Streptosporangiaceae bacterium]|nr:hypothetical protein [Streptosporangiaceae bacterium]
MTTIPAQRAGGEPHRWWVRVFGGIFLASAVTHLVLVTAAPHSYDSFAKGSWWPFVTHAWHSVFVPNVGYFIALLIAFEAAVGLLILSRRYRRIGIAAAIAFNAALILFGWGFCIWSVPAIALLAWFWHLESRPAPASDASAGAGPGTRARHQVMARSR